MRRAEGEFWNKGPMKVLSGVSPESLVEKLAIDRVIQLK